MTGPRTTRRVDAGHADAVRERGFERPRADRPLPLRVKAAAWLRRRFR